MCNGTPKTADGANSFGAISGKGGDGVVVI